MSISQYIENLQINLKKGSERSHYPSLKMLIDGGMTGVNAIIEEKSNQAGIPDFTVRKNEVLLGYIEAKKIGENLAKIEKTEQIQRYLDSAIGQNFILTNYLEFRWYINGKHQLTTEVGTVKQDKIVISNNREKTEKLLNLFLNYQGEIINNPLNLAQQMARYTKAIKYSIQEALNEETEELIQLKSLFQELLIPDLDNDNFADMYAQTITYGLFTARIFHAQNPCQYPFNRETASYYISDKIPFLKGLFTTVITTESATNISWTINILVELLAKIDMGNILENFGEKTGQSDPIVHFYETFLATYEASLRKNRGVYYTPEPVVAFIVRTVNEILETRFNLELGLGNKQVTILDPATGTGTFLYQVIKQIYENLAQYGLAKNWAKYVKESNLLNRLYGFELLMTPYTIAHLKIGLLLENLGYQFQDKERLGIYLTNALDKGVKKSDLILGKYLSEEANQSAKIKTEKSVLVVIGNPPYSGESANKNNPWIEALVKDYYMVDGVSLNEKNPKWLQDDYVKFIRFGQWRIEQTGYGILAFVTNHGYLDNPTFRGMRQNLAQTFDEIHIIDLHGNAKKKEVSPDGKPDKNVFNIQQGVSIALMVKFPHK
jgi:type I restriction-modification system DNA methylase subunit